MGRFGDRDSRELRKAVEQHDLTLHPATASRPKWVWVPGFVAAVTVVAAAAIATSLLSGGHEVTDTSAAQAASGTPIGGEEQAVGTGSDIASTLPPNETDVTMSLADNGEDPAPTAATSETTTLTDPSAPATVVPTTTAGVSATTSTTAVTPITGATTTTTAAAGATTTSAPATTSTAAPTTTTSAPTTTTTTATVTTTTIAPTTDVTWRRVPHVESVFGGDNDQRLRSIVGTGSGFVAVGHDWSGGDWDAAAWHSPDGSAWSRVSHVESVFGGYEWQAMLSVAATDPGLVAVGFDWSGGNRDAAVWQSPDGVSWNQIPHDESVFGGSGSQGMESIAKADSGLVAVGYDMSGGDRDAAVWYSPDGVSWNRVPHDESVFGGAEFQLMDSVATNGSRFVAVGYDSSGGDRDAAVWYSPDGVSWSRVPHDESVFGGIDDQHMWSISGVGFGFVAVGHDSSGGDTDAAVWRSPDGVSWSRVPHDESVFGGNGTQLVLSVSAVGSAWLAVGYDTSGSKAAVWRSPDGVSWSRVPHVESVFGGTGLQVMNSVVATGSGFVAVGADEVDGDADVAVWIGDP